MLDRVLYLHLRAGEGAISERRGRRAFFVGKLADHPAAHKAVFASPQSRAKAARFGRIDLKDYKLPYGADDLEVHWIAEAVTPSDWGGQMAAQDETWESESESVQQRKIELVFDISEVLVAGTAVLDTFIERARHHLGKSLDQYKEELGKARGRKMREEIREPDNRTRNDIERRLRLLRTYDAIELHGLKGPDVIGVLYRHVTGDGSDPGGARDSRLKRCSADKLEAGRIIGGRYRALIPRDFVRSRSSK